MYTIQTRMSNDYSMNCSINDTLDIIDKKIETLALCKLNNIMFNTSQDVDMDIYDDLTTYRKILLDKLLGCNCLEEQRLIEIISRIKRLTR